MFDGAPAPTRTRKILAADLFCGAGGFTEGARQAAERLGLALDMQACVNHWSVAVATHAKNHPDAAHLCQDIATVRPSLAVPGGKLDCSWRTFPNFWIGARSMHGRASR